MKPEIEPLLLTMPGRLPEQAPDIGSLGIVIIILIGLVTLGPILIMVVTGTITGGLITGVSPGEASRVGIRVGIIAAICCWIPIAVLMYLSDLENWHYWRDVATTLIIPLIVLVGMVTTVILVLRTRNWHFL